MGKQDNKNEKTLKGGLIISHGVAIGKAIVILNYNHLIPEYSIKESDIEKEKLRYKKAVEETREEIREFIQSYKDKDSKLIIDILESHLNIIEDETIIVKVNEIIDKIKKNAEFALDLFIRKYTNLIAESNNDYFKQRIHDFIDIKNRINSKLLKTENINIYDMNKTGIIVAESIPPMEAAKVSRKKTLGFVTEIGGATSHSSIIVKGLNIPTIIGIENLLKEIEDGDTLILDAIHGEIIVNPTDQTLNFYSKVREHYENIKKSYLKSVFEDTMSFDKIRIYVNANCETLDEIDIIKKSGAEGIGLYRSEFLFIHRKSLPSEEKQFQAYNEVCEKMFPKKVTIRTFDLGGDKFIEGVTRYENNPYLGWRSVRIAIDHKDMFITQLRALLKASRKRNLRIMFPMISGLEELIKCLDILEEAKESLRKDKIEFDENIKVGTMIEVPSAVIIADLLSEHVDFFSIGTNDLIQYTVAVDRGNKKISHLYDAYHPAILRLIKQTIKAAEKANLEISVCGEVASDPFYVPILIGMGIRNISLSPFAIPEIKKVIRSIKVSEWKVFWENNIFKIKNIQEIKNVVRKKLLEDCPDLAELERFN